MCVCVNFLYVIFVCPSWAPYFGFNKRFEILYIHALVKFYILYDQFNFNSIFIFSRQTLERMVGQNDEGCKKKNLTRPCSFKKRFFLVKNNIYFFTTNVIFVK